ncbi:uncharacterized protein BT62DRAFT_374491 [Guyanagaster necrorhizus]|uniref:Uncharacterized protein n=1 Tax=Guyanagaster necrorhizus TaxID=856835 RepID=A0A9P8AP33_9AGAR|nr:uncharacterized protein BT62DRAFT_692051 [Guyanagaster necrorhizus MCA 3950]XP_043036034.1 uncharacterized protein BT62DRAFT_374491 [Guyanagaster necrorhizus MCA 3950]KAG7439748.1 hypothetical protein BT62DRAFT_692051 [Guyanagaster necrorhizus MCA 3950]KAG7442534.1 hypothetical protein BT62DRAFT_374491 [Guyanagaster necrorhizus MCA 3950]
MNGLGHPEAALGNELRCAFVYNLSTPVGRDGCVHACRAPASGAIEFHEVPPWIRQCIRCTCMSKYQPVDLVNIHEWVGFSRHRFRGYQAALPVSHTPSTLDTR